MKRSIILLITIAVLLTYCGTAVAEPWICTYCNTENSGNFCGNCGAKKPEPVSNEWTCPMCNSINTTNFCSNCGTIKPYGVAPTGLTPIMIPEMQYQTMSVPSVFVGETIAISEEPSVMFSGSISDKNNKDTYQYTPPRDGRYRFDLENIMAPAALRLSVYDSKNKNVFDMYASGAYAVLKAGETYTIYVEQYRGSTDYLLKIGVQKPTTDISTVTTVYDQISFLDQKNVYSFTAPINGRYRFDLTEVKAETKFHTMIWDRLNNNIHDYYAENAYVNLKEGETYQLQVRQYKNFGSYVMRVFCQKETRDITGYDTVCDSIEYEDQKNIYLFTPSIDGLYRFDIAEANANMRFRIMMWDRLENNIMDDYSGGGYVNLKAGETYQLQVRQNKGIGTYKLLIGYQKEAVNVTGSCIINDSITYNDQRNIYFYTPLQSGTYELLLKDYNSSCRFRLMAWDKYEKNIMDQYNGDGTVTLEAGETYQIQVRQVKGCDSYSLTIKVK